MKRDMDLVRDLLLAIDEDPKYDGKHRLMSNDPSDFGISGYSTEVVGYHLDLLLEAGLIAGQAGTRMPIISKVTWDGHDFLDTIRDPDVWANTKEGAKKAGGFTLDLLRDLAKGLIKKKIEDHTGVQL